MDSTNIHFIQIYIQNIHITFKIVESIILLHHMSTNPVAPFFSVAVLSTLSACDFSTFYQLKKVRGSIALITCLHSNVA